MSFDEVDVSTGMVSVGTFYKETTSTILYNKYLKHREIDDLINQVHMDMSLEVGRDFLCQVEFEDLLPSDSYPDGSVFIRITTRPYLHLPKYERYSLVFGSQNFIKDSQDIIRSYYRKSGRVDNVMSKLIFVRAMERVFRKEGVEWK